MNNNYEIENLGGVVDAGTLSWESTPQGNVEFLEANNFLWHDGFEHVDIGFDVNASTVDDDDDDDDDVLASTGDSSTIYNILGPYYEELQQDIEQDIEFREIQQLIQYAADVAWYDRLGQDEGSEHDVAMDFDVNPSTGDSPTSYNDVSGFTGDSSTSYNDILLGLFELEGLLELEQAVTMDHDDATFINMYQQEEDYGNKRDDGLSRENISEYLKIKRGRSCCTTRVGAGGVDLNIETCSVCLNELNYYHHKSEGGGEEDEGDAWIATLECGHEYHANCITKWLLRKNLCPLCKAKALPVVD